MQTAFEVFHTNGHGFTVATRHYDFDHVTQEERHRRKLGLSPDWRAVAVTAESEHVCEARPKPGQAKRRRGAL